MPNLAAVMKNEFRRIARREANATIKSLRRIVTQHRRDLAALKRLAPKLAKSVAFLEAQERGRVAEPQVSEKAASKARFSAKWLKAHRTKLGLSAQQYGRLVGVTALTVYNWESEKGKPSKAKLAALVAVRKVGRREALKRLELIGPAKKPVTKKAKKKRRRKVKKGRKKGSRK
jgi:DNA-binding transcriptional regulator YiaG